MKFTVIGRGGQNGNPVQNHVVEEAQHEIELARILSLRTEVIIALDPLFKMSNATLNHVQVDNMIFNPIPYFHQAS